ncbi:MAG: phage major capsid protein, partial [Oscillospiraceae bacterium]|nr:phage major capsid protein [Oscillospiraceae bacterium]
GGDTGVKAVSEQAWDDVYLTAAELAVIVPFPEAVLEDTSFDVIGQVIPRIIESFGQRVDSAAIFGVNRPPEWQSDLITLARNAGNNVTGGLTYDSLMGPDGLVAKVEGAGALVDGVIASIGSRAALRAIKDDHGRPLYASDMKGGATPYTLDGAPMFFPQNGAFDDGAASVVAGSFASAVYSIRQDVTVKLLDQATIIDPATGAVLYSLAQQDMLAIRAVMRMGWALPNPATRLDPERLNVPFAYIEPAAGASGLSQITYTVRNGASAPLAGVTVNAGGVRKKTGTDGKAVFALPDGLYSVKLTKYGYGVKNDTVTVSGADAAREIVMNAV